MSVPPLPEIQHLQAKLSRAKGRRDSFQERLTQIRTEIVNLKEKESILDHVQVLFQTLVDQEISEALLAVNELQTEALSAVFTDQDLSVKAEQTIARGKVSVSLVTTHRQEGGIVVEDEALESMGQSVSTVQSVLLRILVILRRGLRPWLVLDEALPAFSPNYAANMGEFLENLCSRIGVDILMVTHNQMFYEPSRRCYRVRQHQGAAVFDLVHGGEE